MNAENQANRGLSRVLFAGGGTGGHVFMAVALAQELKKRTPLADVLFVGTPYGLESRVLGPLGFNLKTIHIGGLNRVGTARALGTLLRLPLTVVRASLIVRSFSPSLIVGVGGYASGPVVVGGRLAGCRSLLIEPNAYPGLTNRWLRPWVNGAAVAFEETVAAFGAKARLTGIPIRREFHEIQSGASEGGPLRILVFGGSQGSVPINNLVCDAAASLPADLVTITHQTGKADYERVKNRYRQLGRECEVLAFIDNMPDYFAASDLIIARSGASTVAEVAAAGKPSILIPFPQAADDHQRRNALALVKRNAAVMLDQNRTTGRELAELVLKMAGNRQELIRMGNAGRLLAQPRSVEAILDFMQELARG